MVSAELESNSVVIFDEAHNIDNVCIEALSVTLDANGLEQSAASVKRSCIYVGWKCWGLTLK